MSARVVGRKGGYELRVLTANVLHRVDASLREDGHLARGEGLPDRSGPILQDHVRLSRASDGDDVVAGSGVEVRGQHGAGPKVEHSHCESVADSGREGGSVGVDDATGGEGVLVLLREVEQPV